MSSSVFGTLVGGLVQTAFDYITQGLVTGNIFVYLIVITVLGGIVTLVVWGVRKIFRPGR